MDTDEEIQIKDKIYNMVNIPLMYVTNDKDMYSVHVMKVEFMKVIPFEKDTSLHIHFDSGSSLDIPFDSKEKAIDAHNNIIRMSENYIANRYME